MLGFDVNNRRREIPPELILRCTVSVAFGIFTQIALLLIPYFFSVFPLLFQLLLSVVVLLFAMVIGQFVRRILSVRASAPAFVIFHVIFVWLIYTVVIRQAVSHPVNILFNGLLASLLIGFVRMLASDPGFVRCDPPSSLETPVSEDCAYPEVLTLAETDRCLQNATEEASTSAWRMRYCKSCKVHILAFDHHCPAFGNCIGQKNHVLFMVLLVGFILTEALYALIAYQWMKRNEIHRVGSAEIPQNLAVSTMLFSLVQVLWQVTFFLWHVYCICFNIRTDEWINWRKYPEFHFIVHPNGIKIVTTKLMTPWILRVGIWDFVICIWDCNLISIVKLVMGHYRLLQEMSTVHVSKFFHHSSYFSL